MYLQHDNQTQVCCHMSEFKVGQRVVVNPLTALFPSKEPGTVKSIDEGMLPFSTTIEVSLDNGDIKKYSPGDLDIEKLTSSEVAAEIKKVRSQVDKVSSQLLGETKIELPTHLKYLAEAQESNDKTKVAHECTNVRYYLEMAYKNEFVTKEWYKKNEKIIKKIDGAMKNSSE